MQRPRARCQLVHTAQQRTGIGLEQPQPLGQIIRSPEQPVRPVCEGSRAAFQLLSSTPQRPGASGQL